MPDREPGRRSCGPADVERWLDELGPRPDARDDRDGVTSWDLRLDGRRRFDVPVTLILDPAFALICWVHFAPPIGDAFRKSYRKLLRWNDEFPFVKFSLAEDERPVLRVEIAAAVLAAGTHSGSRSPGRSRSPTGSSRSRRAGSGSAAGSRTRAAGRAAARRCSSAIARRLGELAGTAAPDAPEPGGAAPGAGRRPEPGDAEPAEIEAAIP